MVRLLAALALEGIAWTLGLLGYLLPISEHEWSDEPGMKEQVSADAVLVVVLMCVMGLIAGLCSLAVTRGLKGTRGLRWGLWVIGALALALCVYRLIEVLPVYAG